MDSRERSRAAGRRALQVAIGVCLIVVLTGSAERVPLASLAADASGGNAATVVGLIGKATRATQQAEKELSSALEAGTPDAAALAPAFASALMQHAQAGRDLRTAFALGVPAGQQGFYFAAAGSHRGFNERLTSLLAAYPGLLEGADEKLQESRDMVVAPRSRER